MQTVTLNKTFLTNFRDEDSQFVCLFFLVLYALVPPTFENRFRKLFSVDRVNVCRQYSSLQLTMYILVRLLNLN